YREAVLLGLWVLDFSWGMRYCRGGVSSMMSPPRDFELVGCLENHEGCKPRRGRLNRGFKVPGVFHGYAFCVI
ncbi:unnamed protein product, partial [Ectocarpus sp. 12 AP-2014]